MTRECRHWVSAQRQYSVRLSSIDPNLARIVDHIEAELGRSAWLAGDAFSAADIIMSFPIQAAIARATAGNEKPRMKAFLERVHARPAYQRALERGGKLEILK